ncbi:MAG: cupredoxin domain-containing protein [Dehalococcoidia bacterium]
MKLNWIARLLALVSALAIVAAAAGACGGENGAKDEAKPAGGAAQSAGGGEATQVEVSMTDNVFAPKEIKVPAGKEITFEAKNKGQAVHNMHILSNATEGKDFQSEAVVNPGKESTFKATFNKKGTVKFQCDFHLPDMSGTIIVQ